MSSLFSSVLIGCVGKPNAGKSSFLNACTDAKAKVGNYSFTTIEPNQGIATYTYDKREQCAPRNGACVDGVRHVPVKVLDVAGLIPGASEGLGLGNKFLDDLRHASVLMHVIDVSGTTDEKGEATEGYDPTNDVEWLRQEIHSWIFNNLWKKWGNIVRRHVATKTPAAETLQLQLSGYGTKITLVHKVLSQMHLGEIKLQTWDEDMVHKMVDIFLELRFPTVLVLNKIDMEHSDSNLAKLCDRYPNAPIVPCSALSEFFLRKLNKQGYVRYKAGDEFFATKDDDEDRQPGDKELKPLDTKIDEKLTKLRDLVMYRYGGTGVQDAINRAVDEMKMVPVFWVRNLHTMQSDKGDGAFKDCALVSPNTTVGELFRSINHDSSIVLAYAESPCGKRVSEDSFVSRSDNVLRFVTKAEAWTEK